VSALAASADRSRALSVGSDLTVQLWDLRGMESLASFTLDDFPRVCALTADGETAIVGDRRSLHLLKFHDSTP